MEISGLNNKVVIFAGKIPAVLFIISLFVLTSCSNDKNNDKGVSGGTPVDIAHPAIMNLNDYLVLNANTVFLNKEIIRVPFQGFIEKIYKNIGDEVNPGDILFRIKTKEYAANDSMKIRLGNELFTGSIPVNANSKGVLTKLDYHNGDFVADGEELAIISNPSTLRIKLNVPFEDALKIKIGHRCEIDLPDGEKLNGIIEKSVPSVDPSSQAQTYLVKLSGKTKLPENLNLIVRIPYRTVKNAVVLPKSSINTNVTEDNFWIMKLVNDTTAVRVDIIKGIENDSLVQVISPQLNISDKIASLGSYALPDTAKVEIVK